MAECQHPLLLCLLATYVVLAMFCISSAQAASTRGCLAEMFTTAGVPARDAKKYEKNLANNRIQISALKASSPWVLRFLGVPHLLYATYFHNCHWGSSRSQKCKAYKACSGRGLCKLSWPRRKSEVMGYQCNCSAGYSGSSCETDACHKTCQNGGSCKRTQRGDRFQCTCKPGYIGKRCEKTLNRCNPNPCANGGLCRPLHNDFSCTCKGWFAGKRCESHLLTEKELDKKLDNKLGTVVNAIKELGASVSKAISTSISRAIASQTTVMLEKFKPLEQWRCVPRGKQLTLQPSSVYTAVLGLEKNLAYCDMKTAGGGWTVIQRRQDGSVRFYDKTWAAYKAGFGSLTGEFWWGLEKIHLMTSSGPHELRIDMVTRGGKRIAATYSSFRVDSEKKKYKLHISGFKGYGTKDWLAYHNGMYFSTVDRDNDVWASSCAASHQGAWWYNSCHWSNLNAKYNTRHIVWHTTVLKFVEMKIRPRK